MSAITRRQFLKWGTASAAFFTLGSQLGCRGTRLSGKRRPTSYRRSVSSIPTTCTLCPAGCGILAFVKDGRLIHIEGNPEHPQNRGSICARGIAGKNLLYDPERIVFPLRRVGARGENRWEAISWKDAYEELGGKLKSLKDEGLTNLVTFHGNFEASAYLVPRFLKAFGSPLVLSSPFMDRTNEMAAHVLTFGAEGAADIGRSRYILNFGSNLFEVHHHFVNAARRIVDQVSEGRVKLVTFDTRLTRTAAKSHRWFCPNPGSESFIALAMAKQIVDKGLHNEPFMRQWTNASPQEVVRHLSLYSLQKAEELSGIPASEIETAAVEFATTKPAVALSGDATTHDARGTQAARSITLLNIITGNIDTPGGYCLPRRYPVGGTDNLSACQAAQSFFPGLVEKSRASQVYIAYKTNPAYSNPDTQRTLEVLKDEKVLPFVVVMDTTMSETGMLADLFLPLTTHLEQWGLVSRPSLTMVPWVGIQQPVTEPLGESKPIHDILIELAQAVGAPLDEEFSSPSVESYLSSDLSSTPELSEAGGLDLLKRKGAFWKKEERPRYRLYEKEGFPTPSGKLEIYSPTVKERGGSPMPVYEPPPEPSAGTLVLTLYEENVLTQNMANAKWLSEISHRGAVLINPQTAEERGIKAGDHVRISSLIGSVTAKATLSEGVHPRVIALPTYLGHWSFGSTAKGKRFESEDPDTHLIWWGEEAHRVHPQSLVTYSFDPIGGGVAWRDTLVTVTKVESGGDRDHS